jgi:hypothetical protein
VFGNLPAFTADASDILKVLDIQHAAVVGLVRNGGTVFASLGQNQAALRGLVTSSHTVFTTTANNNNQLARIFQVFPTFLNESKLTMARLQSFSSNTDPLLKELVPVAQDLGPTLHDVQVLSPDLQKLFVKLGPLIDVSQTGLPAYAEVLRGAKPMIGALGTFLSQLNPILTWLSAHQQLVSDFISNGAYGLAGMTPAFGGAGMTCSGVPCGHYLRQFGPTGQETFSIYSNRDANNRGNTYPPPVWLTDPQNLVKGNFAAWDCNNTGGPHPASGSNEACWVAPTLPGAKGPQQIPHLTPAHYSNR